MAEVKDLMIRTTRNLSATEVGEIAKQGLKVVSCLEEHCYRLRGTLAGGIEDVGSLEFVAELSEYQTERKVSVGLRSQITAAAAAGLATAPAPVRVVVSLDSDIADETVDALEQLGNVLERSRRRALLEVSGAQIGDVAALAGVLEVEPEPENRTQNNVARGLARVDTISTSLGLDGTGEIVGVADSGLDNGDAATILADFAGRVVNLRATVDKSALGVNDEADLNNHGTHVSGSILSDGANSNGQIQGMAPAAQLTLLSMGPNNSTGLQVPVDLQSGVFQDAYDDGARLHNNSWGSNTLGNYTAFSADVDEFMRDNPDMLILIAAGNAGPNAGTVNPPGTAKNALTVGAAESVRPLPAAITLNNNPQDNDFNPVTPPVNVPLQANNWSQLADDQDDIATFSSRGPTDDGRIAPDLVAPGSWILSCRSSISTADTGPDGLNHAALGIPPPYGDDADGVATHPEAVGRGLPGAPFFGTFDQNTPAAPAGSGANAQNNYFYDSGTSMATPITTGATTLLRQYLRQRRGVANPSAALMKAMLVNGATVPAAQSNDPNNTRGFGWLNLQNTIAPQPTGQQTYSDDVDMAIATGDIRDLQLQVADPAQPLRVTLAYNDAPGAVMQNKLYLRLVEPDGVTTHDGDTSAFPAVSNNLQRVHVAAPAAGTWTIQVHGIEVLNGIDAFPGEVRQDFALAVINGVGFSPEPADVVQTIDVSGSMAFYGYMEPAKERASQFVDLLRVNDRTGVVTFNGAAATPHPVVPIAGFATQAAVQAAIGGVAAGGVTSMGAGLERALVEMTAGGDASHPQAIVLLSDGHENTPPWIGGGATDSPPAWYGGGNLTEILPTVPAGMKVYTVSLGVQSDQVLLQDIAAATGGVFHAIHSPAEISALHEIYVHLQALAGGEEVIAAGSDSLFGSGSSGTSESRPEVGNSSGDALATDLAASLANTAPSDLAPEFLARMRFSNTHSVPVDDTVEEVTFVTSWQEAERGVTVQAISPSGKIFGPSNADSAHRGSSWEYLRLRNPEPGDWRIVVRGRPRRSAWWGAHPYTWGCYAATPIGVRIKLPRKLVGSPRVGVAADVLGRRDHVRSLRFGTNVNAPATSIARLLDKHRSALRDIDLRIKPDTPKLDPDLLKLAVLDVRMRAKGETVFRTVKRRLSLTASSGFQGMFSSQVSGLYTANIVARGKTRKGHAFRRESRFNARV